MGHASDYASGLLQRAPGQALIEKLLSEWDAGRIRPSGPDQVEIDDEARGWYWGVLGERRVAAYLDQLPREWTVLHSLPIGSGMTDVDHLAIGPSGVFVINTKYSPDSKIWVAGRGLLVNGSSRAAYLRASMAELDRVTSALSEAAGFAVPVVAAIVFVAPQSLTVREPAGWDGQTVEVIPEAGIYRLLDRRRELSDEQLSRVVEVAVRPETWHRTFRDSRPGAHLAREFDALRDAVGPAPERTRPPERTRSTRAAAPTRRRRPTTRARRQTSAGARVVGRLVGVAVGLGALLLAMLLFGQVLAVIGR